MNLDVDAPEKVADVLRAAAQRYRESNSELQSAWQDNGIVVWERLAAILERAAGSCERAVKKCS
jgi:hypothetical protein